MNMSFTLTKFSHSPTPCSFTILLCGLRFSRTRLLQLFLRFCDGGFLPPRRRCRKIAEIAVAITWHAQPIGATCPPSAKRD